jgi:hypothetical protein
MLKKLPQKFSIQPIIEQTLALNNFGKRLDLNNVTGEFFNDPWETLPEFKNTPIGNLLDSLGGIGQARLLCLNSAESYTAHADPDDRIHLAIVTNPFSFLVDIADSRLYHIPADGQLWHMNTGKIHVAANWGPRTRIHLNVRVLLPKFDASLPAVRIKVIEGDYDWKQLAYTPVMCLINKSIKDNIITGFKGISDREILVNTTNDKLFDSVVTEIRALGIDIECVNL